MLTREEPVEPVSVSVPGDVRRRRFDDVFAVALKEWRETWRDGRLRAAGVTVMALLLAALFTGLRDHRRMLDERASAEARASAQWINQGSKNPHSAAHYGIYVFRKPGPLAFFDRGVLAFSGSSLFLEAHKENLPLHAAAQDGTLARRLGDWTAANVLRVLFPLLIVLMAFGTFATERERGTWLLLRSLGVSVHRYLWGKVLGLGVVLLVLLLPVAIAIGAVVVMSASGSGGLDLLLRASWIGAAYLSYFAVVLALAIAVSVLAASARQALIVLLAVWAAWALVLPRMIADTAAALYPVPLWAEIDSDLAREQGLSADAETSYEERVAAVRARTLEKYGKTKTEDLPIDFGGEELLAAEEWGNTSFDRHFGALDDAYRAQNRLIRAGAAFTPFLAVQSASMALSGTDAEHEMVFRRAVALYRRDFVRRMNREVREHPAVGGQAYTADQKLWKAVTPFTYEEPHTTDLIGRHAMDWLALAAWMAGACWLLRAAGHRLETGAVR